MINEISGFLTNNVRPKTSRNETVGRDEFLKLLTFQLKAQNPLKPYDNQEFATQLAQFSQLEQLTDIRSLLENQVEANLLLGQTMTNSALPGMIGKNARAYSDTLYFDGDSSVKIGYNLQQAASTGKIKILDESGGLVKVFDLSGLQLRTGDKTIEWDGTDMSGNEKGTGKYKIEAEFTDSNGSKINTFTFIEGMIESVKFKNEGTILVVGGIEIPLQNITDISLRG